MRYRGLPSLSKARFGMSFRGLFELVFLAAMLIALVTIEPMNKALVRNVIKQNATDHQLSHFANEIIIQSLLCRRFEKDILLQIDNKDARLAYQNQWAQAVSDLEQAILGFQINALHAVDREQARVWRTATIEYQKEVLELLQGIDNGTITQSAEANDMLASAKRSIRTVTDTATAVAQTKDAAVDTSSAAISNTLTTSARLMTLLILAGCIAWVTITRRQ